MPTGDFPQWPFGGFVATPWPQPTTWTVCNCIGPQPGERFCPCRLRGEREREATMLRDGVIIEGRRYRLIPDGEA